LVEDVIGTVKVVAELSKPSQQVLTFRQVSCSHKDDIEISLEFRDIFQQPTDKILSGKAFFVFPKDWELYWAEWHLGFCAR
jgi:hypothetical protein